MISPDHVKRAALFRMGAGNYNKKPLLVKLKQSGWKTVFAKSIPETKILAFLLNDVIDGKTGGIDYGSHL